jgi:hypothetical protein
MSLNEAPNNKSPIVSCSCQSTKDNTNYRDLFIEKIINYLNNITQIYAKLLGALASIIGSLLFFVLFQISLKIEFSNAAWYSNMFGLIRATLPVEFIIAAGFFAASISATISKWAEVILLILIGAVGTYWSFTNGEWFALAASVFMIFYGVVRTKLLNNMVDDYILSFCKHSMIVIFSLLTVNFILKLNKNFV